MKKSKKLQWHELLLIAIIIIQVVFMILKLTKTVLWAWWIICLPVGIPVALLVIAVIILCAVYSDEGEDYNDYR